MRCLPVVAAAFIFSCVGTEVDAQTTQTTPQPGASATPDIAEVVVSGFRLSLEKSLEFKSQDVGVVDAISSEDLGKFPDTNIAEALQRIPGVAISRDDGEGQFITVRGLGPSFQEVLVNGRQTASALTGDPISRGFDFSLYPSEMITGAQVYKSGVASLPSGGIGATINLTTARPFDFEGRQTLFSAKAQYEDSLHKTTPDLFALYSDRFDDGKLGFLVSAYYSKRDSQIDEMNLQWASFDPSTALTPGTKISNPAGVATAFYPIQYQEIRTEDQRTRINFETALQYQPIDNLIITLDGMLNMFSQQQQEGWFLTFQTLTSMNNFVLNDEGTVKSFTNNDLGAYETGSAILDQREWTRNGGLNVAWKATDEVGVVFDLSYSSAFQPAGTNGFANLGFRANSLPNPPDVGFSYNLNGEFPNLTLGIPESTLLNKNYYTSHVMIFGEPAFGGNVVHDTIYEPKIEVTYKPVGDSILKSLKAGFDFTSDHKDDLWLGQNAAVYCLYCGYLPQNTVPGTLLSPANLSGFLSGVPGNFPQQFYTFNPYSVAAYLSTPGALATNDTAHGYAPGTSQSILRQYGGGSNGYGLVGVPGGYRVEEHIFSPYVEESLAGSFGPMPWASVFGLRYDYTQTTAGGFSQTPTALGIIDPTQYSIALSPANPALAYQESSYGRLLPNFDFRLTLAKGILNARDTLLARFSASQTLTQPLLDDIAPSLTFNTPRPNLLTGNGGNVDLKPYVSTNFDYALEYYFGGINYVSVGFFQKDIQDFIVYEAVPQSYTIKNPDKISDVNISGDTATFAITEPVNAQSAKLQGTELTVQWGFDFLPGFLSGFGVTANTTIVHSNAGLNPSNYSQSFAIPGLSNTENATLFYSRGRIDARVSENWRSKYLNTFAGFATEPTYVDAYHQMDARVSFDWSRNADGTASVFLEGYNVTNQKQFQSGRFADQFADYQEIGARYALGVRVKF